jgi:C4-dicarboxylate-specific signal transduction histidine kinase
MNTVNWGAAMGIDKDKIQAIEAAELRWQAEERMCAKTAGLHPPWTDEEMLRLLHELEVHQVELEMQNAELRRARDEMESALERYTDLYDFAPVGYFTLYRDGAISAVNLTGAGLLGIERSRLLGRRFGLFLTRDNRAAFELFLIKLFENRSKEECEVVLMGKGDSQLFVHIYALACKSGQECRVAVNDISKRRCAENVLIEKQQELEEINSTLETRILKDVEELRRKDQLLIVQERLSLMGDMINNIAHQWRQPLNTLALRLQYLPLAFDSAVSNRELLENNVGKSMELIQYMSRTINDFRNFFRSDKEAVAFGANQVIAHSVSLIEKSFKDQQVSIEIKSSGEPMVNGYPNEYAQVLLNILMNARDALVERHVDDARISLHAFAEGDKTVVTISDNAGGIADEIIDRLFESYFTTKGPDKGTGIGLFMSKTIIEKNMGGRLTVRNTGNGAEFRIEV